MIWQDWVFAVGQLIFVIALVPTVRDGPHPKPLTCWLTGITLVAFALCFATLALYWACGMTFIAASLWLWMATEQMV